MHCRDTEYIDFYEGPYYNKSIGKKREILRTASVVVIVDSNVENNIKNKVEKYVSDMDKSKVMLVGRITSVDDNNREIYRRSARQTARECGIDEENVLFVNNVPNDGNIKNTFSENFDSNNMTIENVDTHISWLFLCDECAKEAVKNPIVHSVAETPLHPIVEGSIVNNAEVTDLVKNHPLNTSESEFGHKNEEKSDINCQEVDSKPYTGISIQDEKLSDQQKLSNSESGQQLENSNSSVGTKVYTSAEKKPFQKELPDSEKSESQEKNKIDWFNMLKIGTIGSGISSLVMYLWHKIIPSDNVDK